MEMNIQNLSTSTFNEDDPYGYARITIITNDGKKVISHRGLVEWIKIDGADVEIKFDCELKDLRF